MHVVNGKGIRKKHRSLLNLLAIVINYMTPWTNGLSWTAFHKNILYSLFEKQATFLSGSFNPTMSSL